MYTLIESYLIVSAFGGGLILASVILFLLSFANDVEGLDSPLLESK